MLRAILSVVAGYLALFLVVFVSFTVAYLAMGADRAFQPASYDVSGLWIGLSLVVSLVGALAGGYVAAHIARTPTPPRVLAGLVLVLGLLVAIPGMTGGHTGTPIRTGSVPNLEAIRRAQLPVWLTLVNPLIGAFGVLMGAGLGRRAPG